jgi:hypothetical protein
LFLSSERLQAVGPAGEVALVEHGRRSVLGSGVGSLTPGLFVIGGVAFDAWEVEEIEEVT